MPTMLLPQNIDPGRCLICKVSLDHRDGPLHEIKRLRDALTFINAIAGTAEEGEVKALNDICRASHAALNPS